MKITTEQLIALLPMLLTGLTVVLAMLGIAWRRSHGFTATITAIGLNLALFSLWPVMTHGSVEVTQLLKVDGFAMFYSCLILLASLATCTFAWRWLQDFNDNKDEFYLLILIATLGGLVLTMASHFASLFIGIELLSLPLFGLVGYAFRHKRSLEAALKYTILSAAASSFLLFGIALIYASTGELNFAAIAQLIGSGEVDTVLFVTGFGLLIIGAGFKLSLVPFHLWTPDVYQGSPAPVAAFLATASKIAIFAVLVRLFLTIPINQYAGVRTVLAIVAFASMLIGNLLAVSQGNIKRLLGYSSIAHLGYLLVALLAAGPGTLSVEASGIYLVGYLLSSLGAFGVVSLMSRPGQSGDTESLYSFRGLFWHRPVLSSVMAVMMLSLAGIPATLGFIGKLYILAISVQDELWWLTGGVIVGSAIGLFYYLRVTISLFLNGPGTFMRDTSNNWAFTAGGIVVLLSAILVLLLGLYPQPLIDLVRFAKPFG